MTTTQTPTTKDERPISDLKFDEMNCPVKKTPGWHFDNFDRLREQAPVMFGDASGNPFWLVTRMSEILGAFQKPEIFSSSAVVPDAPNPPYLWIPEMLDPPVHTKWRHLLGPVFAPGAIQAMEPRLNQRFNEILDEVAPRGHCDFVQDVALRFPNVIFMELMGLPVADADLFQKWETAILHNGSSAAEGALSAMNSVIEYFGKLIAERRQEPRKDVISRAIAWQIDGEPVNDNDLLAMCLLLFMAGLDTVAAQMSYSILHLAQNADDRERLVVEPALIPTAIEEFLRYYAFVTPGRKAMSDTEIAGCPVKSGDMVYLPLVSANRDPREFPDADKVLIDRQNNRHLAFGAGPHRCLGSHLARRELSVAITGWHERIPSYRLDTSVPITEHGGQIGLDNLPLIWDV